MKKNDVRITFWMVPLVFLLSANMAFAFKIVGCDLPNWEDQGLWDKSSFKDQAGLNSCQTFATTSLVEALYFQIYGEHEVFSETQLFWKHFLQENSWDKTLNQLMQMNNLSELSMHFNQAGNVEQIYSLIKNEGICREEDFPIKYQDLDFSINKIEENFSLYPHLQATSKEELAQNLLQDIILNPFDKKLYASHKNHCLHSKSNEFSKKIELNSLVQRNNPNNHFGLSILVKSLLSYGPLALAIRDMELLQEMIEKYEELKNTDDDSLARIKVLNQHYLKSEINPDNGHLLVLVGLNCQGEAIIRNSYGENKFIYFPFENLSPYIKNLSLLTHPGKADETLNSLGQLLDEEILKNHLANLAGYEDIFLYEPMKKNIINSNFAKYFLKYLTIPQRVENANQLTSDINLFYYLPESKNPAWKNKFIETYFAEFPVPQKVFNENTKTQDEINLMTSEIWNLFYYIEINMPIKEQVEFNQQKMYQIYLQYVQDELIRGRILKNLDQAPEALNQFFLIYHLVLFQSKSIDLTLPSEYQKEFDVYFEKNLKPKEFLNLNEMSYLISYSKNTNLIKNKIIKLNEKALSNQKVDLNHIKSLFLFPASLEMDVFNKLMKDDILKTNIQFIKNYINQKSIITSRKLNPELYDE